MQAHEDMPGENWFDSHCHLDSLEIAPEHAVSAATSAGVAGILNVGTDLASSAASAGLGERFQTVWAAVGIHPHEAKHVDDEALDELIRLAEAPKVAAIGEIGLDFFRDHSPRSMQLEAFRSQLQIAQKLGKPVVLHIRDAHPEAFGVLEQTGDFAGLIFHCFSAGPEEVVRALDMDGYVSFAGNISFRKSESIQKAAKLVPLDRLLVETDAPYLAPIPHRGKPNEPALLPEVGRALAEARGCPVAEIAQNTRQNAHRAFRLSL